MLGSADGDPRGERRDRLVADVLVHELGRLPERVDVDSRVEAEALVSMIELYRLTGKDEYYAAFAQTLDFVEKFQVAREGSWWATRNADGSPKVNQRSSPWQGAYHNGRAMLLSAKLLEELADKPGTTKP